MKTDIQIAQETNPVNITEIAKEAGIDEKYLELYGYTKAKINYNIFSELDSKEDGKLILVTAISPTPAGEGKTTTTVGLADGLRRKGKNAMVALREPSLGPVFGVKGGATGGGYAQVIPMEDINLHFTGDLHAIGAANNLVAALLDNHIQQGNVKNIDVRKIVWNRCLDMNDRQLRNIVNGIGGKANGTPREDHFDITVASEIMAVLCLCSDIEDLKNKVADIVVAYDYDDNPVKIKDINGQGAVAALLKDALKPNLVQTLEKTPAFIHGGPFANIAHGCNSVIATKMAMKLSDYTVTEAGFGADLGAEKFIDIKCRLSGLNPDAVVLVATIRALKHHGGVLKAELGEENLQALEVGMSNLKRHIENIQNIFKKPVVVAINKFPTDTKRELDLVYEVCQSLNVSVSLSDVWAKGGEGALDLAQKVIDLAEKPSSIEYLYDVNDSIEKKIETIAKKLYKAKNVLFDAKAKNEMKKLEKLGYGKLPICMAKTQYSFSDNPKLLGAPEEFTLTIKNMKVSAGAGFVVVLTGNIMTMPGLPKVPAAEKIDIDKKGVIEGLF